MNSTLMKLLIGILMLILISLRAGTEQGLEGTGQTEANPAWQGTAERLPVGMERSDWESIHAAHEDWKHTIRAKSERQSGWRAENPGTGLHATFDERGAEVSPPAGQWGWGLELLSYGVGTEQQAMAQRKPKIGVSGRRIGYQWDGNIEEWYQNRAHGIEHGYTIQKRPGARGEAAPLELRMGVRGEWPQVEVIDKGRGATFGRQSGEALVRYHGLVVIDAEGREVAARLEAEERGELRLIVEEQTASYPLTIDPTISQQAYLKASNTDNFDYFGTSVAISGNTVVVGADGEASNATGVPTPPVGQDNDSLIGAGAAYVFVRSGGSWSQEAYLKASNTGGGDRFGFSVAISGETIVVGAKGEASSATGVDPPGGGADNSAGSAGAAYVFVRSSGSWTQQAYLKASNTEQGDFFGNSLSISGETIVVGAPGEDSSAKGVNQNETNNDEPESGAAYVFVRSGGLWSQQAYLKASNTDLFDEFGQSVAISGETIVVGAQGEASSAKGVNPTSPIGQSDNSAFGAGAAYVFVRSGGSWSQEAYLKASNTDARDYFGQAVTISEDTIVVGAYREESSATGVNPTSPVGQGDNTRFDAGAAYVFVRSSGLWSQEAYLKASNTGSFDQFGRSVAISGNAVVVGAQGEASRATGVNPTSPVGQGDNSRFDAGAAYVFVRTNGSWGQQAYLKASNTDSNDEFGGVVAISHEKVIVGATREASNAVGVNPTSPAVGQDDNTGSGTGAAYLFFLPSITINAGDGQSALVGSSVVTRPSVIVRDGLSNPVAGVSVTFAVASGGGSITGGSATTNASGIATVGSWTLGPVAGSNTLTATSAGLAGSPLTFTAMGILLPTASMQVEGTAVPGGTVTVTTRLTNTQSTTQSITLNAPLPAGLSGVSCDSVTGTCVIGAGTKIAPGGGELYRRQSVSSPAATSTVTWTGTIPGNTTVTITHVVQVSVMAANGTQYQLASTINGFPGPGATMTVSATPAGPGDSIGLVFGQAAAQKPGSVLIYNLYASGSNPAASDSRVSITNTSPSRRAYVHFFFVDGSNCSVADMKITLTANQTTSFLASDFDPGVTGYLIAVATDANGCPEVHNHLVGESQVRLESGHRAALPALSVAALGLGGQTCSPNATTTTLAFDGLSYNALSRTLAVSGLSSIANGYSSLLVVNRIGGDLGTGAARLGSLFGLLYDDQEASQSFTLPGDVCQLRGVLGNNFPRTAPRYTTVIPAGRTGWMKFAAVDDEAITGALLVEALDGFSGGHNLHHLTTTNTATLTIPVYPAR